MGFINDLEIYLSLNVKTILSIEDKKLTNEIDYSKEVHDPFLFCGNL